MTSDHGPAADALLSRADRAIANAVALRAAVEADLAAAGRYRPFWPGSRVLASPPPLAPMPVEAFLGCPASPDVGTALGDAGAPDPGAEAAWRLFLPSIETPVDLFSGATRLPG